MSDVAKFATRSFRWAILLILIQLKSVPYEQLPELDRYMLQRMTEVFRTSQKRLKVSSSSAFSKRCRISAVDLSNFYLMLPMMAISALRMPSET